MPTFYDFTATDAEGNLFDFNELHGKVVLVVNVASHCAFASQYAGLEELSRQFENDGFSVIAFPCNQFGRLEPDEIDAILKFAKKNYDVTFPVMAKIEVNGPQAHPLFEFLKHRAPGVMGTEGIKWNFTKFLISRNGQVLNRYAPQTEPMDLVGDIQRALGIHMEQKAI